MPCIGNCAGLRRLRAARRRQFRLARQAPSRQARSHCRDVDRRHHESAGAARRARLRRAGDVPRSVSQVADRGGWPLHGLRLRRHRRHERGEDHRRSQVRLHGRATRGSLQQEPARSFVQLLDSLGRSWRTAAHDYAGLPLRIAARRNGRFRACQTAPARSADNPESASDGAARRSGPQPATDRGRGSADELRRRIGRQRCAAAHDDDDHRAPARGGTACDHDQPRAIPGATQPLGGSCAGQRAIAEPI